jgi:hypothetical protein
MDLKRGFTAIVLCITLVLAGCTTAWITEVENIITAVIPAVVNIITLVGELDGSGVSATDLNLVRNVGTQATGDLQLLQSLIAQYQKADATAQPGLLREISILAVTIQTNLTALLPALHISDAATEAKVVAVVGLVVSEIDSLVAVLPIVNTGNTGVIGGDIRLPAYQLKSPPLSASAFVSSYNSTMTAKTGNAALDKATSGLKIHLHGRFMRFVTVGILK